MTSLRELLQTAKLEKVPTGWLTREQLAKSEGISEVSGSMTILIRDAKRLGLLEEKSFHVRWGRIIRPRPHYRRVK